jgi:NADH-quinone oxidoreductase subunit F
MHLPSNDSNTVVKVGLASCGIAAGGQEVFDYLAKEVAKRGLPVSLKKTGCLGMCFKEVLVEVAPQGNDGRIIYGEVTPKRAERILKEHLENGHPIKEWIVLGDDIHTPFENFFAKQRRIVLRNCGVIDPECIDEYVDAGGYQALEKVVKRMGPDKVIEEVGKSGLRGRGGAGFPTGRKWELTRRAWGEPKYVVCNADEGDPGAFMDRSVLESDPHSVLEGLLIAGYAIGASDAYIYVRAEYPLAVKRLRQAIRQAEERGYLGESILGTHFGFRIRIMEGAGAFVCGEETALIASLEGRRGMPRFRPPFPATSGLWGRPTCINNVETLANIPWIITNGGKKFSECGTKKSKGTKVFALAGKITRGGLVEVPMGISLREVIADIGGGIQDGGRLKAVQIGGPSGGCIPETLAHTLVDYESVTRTGAIMGSGGMVVMDQTACMVDVAKFFLSFTQKESCGKCTFCRIGTLRMLEILERITEGRGHPQDLELLEDLADKVKEASLCGLGQTAPNPVLTTLRYFKDEYEAHILERRCPAKKCRALITFEIIPEKCNGCRACLLRCPSEAITGEKKKPHHIDQEKCTQCGICLDSCKFDAVLVK